MVCDILPMHILFLSPKQNGTRNTVSVCCCAGHDPYMGRIVNSFKSDSVVCFELELLQFVRHHGHGYAPMLACIFQKGKRRGSSPLALLRGCAAGEASPAATQPEIPRPNV